MALVFTREAVRAVDHAAVHEYGIPGVVLMEHAAIGLHAQARCMLARMQDPQPTIIICGPGNNGGDGYAVARLLHNSGHAVQLLPLGEPRAGTDAHINFDICRRMHLPFIRSAQLAQTLTTGRAMLVIDAIFGTGLDKPVTGDAADLITRLNEHKAGTAVLAADLPSGLDCDTGEPLGCAVQADATVAFVGWKQGFLNPRSRSRTGEVIVADIGAPRELVTRFGRELPEASS